MKINLIVVQYQTSYPGELMPNVVDAWDEYVLEDNFEGFQESLNKHKAREGKDYEWVRVLVVEVPDDVVVKLGDWPVVTAKTMTVTA